ncbi:MAG: hypothetical protein ACD_46C00566G0002 [uncultured bacterium]|nr:MAG: hypothetical protein ACD_46C00566G0002 [uncultured bacterium]
MHKIHYSKMNLFFRSLIFSIYSLSTIFLYSFIVAATFPLSLRYRYMVIRLYLRAYIFVLKKICHIDYVVEGLENIPSDKAGVVMSKHQSTWETFFLPLIFNDPAVITKRELMWIPFFGWALAISKPISINRREKASAMQQVITKGKKYLAEGRWVLLFPEGTRTSYGHVGHYRLGGARLAVAADSFIIPVAHDAGRVWPRRKFIKYPGTVHVVVGPAIHTTGRTPEEVLQLTKNWIETTMLRLSVSAEKRGNSFNY